MNYKEGDRVRLDFTRPLNGKKVGQEDRIINWGTRWGAKPVTLIIPTWTPTKHAWAIVEWKEFGFPIREWVLSDAWFIPANEEIEDILCSL